MADATTRDLYSLERGDLRSWAEALGQEPFRGDQVFAALWRPPGPQRFSELPPALRSIVEAATAPAADPAGSQSSRDGTVKDVLVLADGAVIERVSIPAGDRRTVCVSTQVGCPVGCSFCLSGQHGCRRNLTPGEIAWQVASEHHRHAVTNVVFMGSGEPFLNYQATISAIRILADERGIGLGSRRFTVSTCGVPEGIRRLAADEPQANLAFSLHAADDLTRQKLVPLAARFPLAEISAALDDYSAITNRRVTFECCLIAGVNTSRDHARGLAAFARHHRAFVNIIPFNPVPGLEHQRPSHPEVDAFCEILHSIHPYFTLRQSRGRDIAAACGQLAGRARTLDGEGGPRDQDP